MKIVKLGDIVHRVRDFVDKDNTDLTYYVGGEHFDNGSMTVNNRGTIIGSTIGPAFKTKFEAGDVLLMSRNPHLRKAGMVNFDGICSDVSYIIRTNDENVLLQEFIPILFQSDIFWNFAERNKKGSTNFFLNWSDFERFEFRLPDIETQRKLSEVLWSINETRTHYKEMKEILNLLIESEYIYRFGNVFKGENKYQLIKIGDVVEKRIDRASSVFESDDNIRYLDISSIDNTRNLVVGYTDHIMGAAPSRAQQHVKKSDIVVSTVRPNLNNVSIVEDDYTNIVASSGFCVLRAEKINIDYLFALVSMRPFADYLSSLTVGANYPAVNKKQILDFEIPNAPESEQLKFSAFLNKIKNLKFKLYDGDLKLESTYRNIVNQYLTDKE